MIDKRARIFGVVIGGLIVVLTASYIALRSSLSGSAIGPRHVASFVVGAVTPKINICPICGERSNFLPMGDRDRALCRVCGSQERHRLLYLYMRDRTGLFRDRLSLLHFSPEPGLARAFRRQKNLTYKTSQYEPESPADFHLDLTNLDQPDNSWDVLLVYHVFEHIPDDRAGIREVFRVLKPGGYALLSVPVRDGATLEDPTVTTPEEREERFGQHDHVRFYGWKDFGDRLTAVGFAVTIEQPALTFSDEVVREYGLSRASRIYVARKPAIDALP